MTGGRAGDGLAECRLGGEGVREREALAEGDFGGLGDGERAEEGCAVGTAVEEQVAVVDTVGEGLLVGLGDAVGDGVVEGVAVWRGVWVGV